MARVCGSKRRSPFSWEATVLPSSTRWRVCWIARDQGQHLLPLAHQKLRLPLRALAEHLDDLRGLVPHLLGGLNQGGREPFLLGFFVFPFAPQLPMQGLGRAPGRREARAAQLLDVAHLVLQQAFGPLDQPAEHAHTVHEQAEVFGVWDLGLHTGGVQTQLATPGDLYLASQLAVRSTSTLRLRYL